MRLMRDWSATGIDSLETMFCVKGHRPRETGMIIIDRDDYFHARQNWVHIATIYYHYKTSYLISGSCSTLEVDMGRSPNEAARLAGDDDDDQLAVVSASRFNSWFGIS
jgi:hypothetical protein